MEFQNITHTKYGKI